MEAARAVILLSGGLDSATVLALARAEGFSCYALSFDYGQRHAVELAAARRVAAALGAVTHQTARVDLTWIGGSALTADIPVPKDALVDHDDHDAPIPITYVPGRNALFLCYAVAWAEILGAEDIFAGMNALDYSGYPDCRPPFLKAFTTMARLGTRAGTLGRPLRIRAPLLRLGKSEIIRLGTLLGVDYGMTHSCYDPTVSPDDVALACGHCDSCLLRRRGFLQAGVADPTPYVSGVT